MVSAQGAASKGYRYRKVFKHLILLFPRQFGLLHQEVAAMGNSTLPNVLDKLNVMSTIHLRKLIATLVRENAQRDAVIGKLEERIGVVENRLNEIKNQPNSLPS
ncbi:MAG: hypothetical protein WBZ36_15260 [Candidatus Nitrosopolaris sp.]